MELSELGMWRLTHLAFGLNMKLDAGTSEPWEDVRPLVEDGTVFEWLRHEDVDLTFEPGEPEELCLIEFFRSVALAVDEHRKFGVDQNAYSVLLAYCIEGIQQKSPL